MDSSRSFSLPDVASSSFPYLHQIINITSPDGHLPIPLSHLDIYESDRTRSGMLYSAQIAAAVMMLIVQVIVTKPAKRNTPVFYMNMASLIALILSSSLSLSYFLSSWVQIYVQFTGDTTPVSKKDYNISVAAACSRVLLITCIQTSLVLQCRTVYSTSRKMKALMTGIASSIASAVIILWIYLTVVGIKSEKGPGNRAELTRQIIYSASIYFFCAVFIAKLIQTILLRKKLGLKQFGPIQVITIMGCQTMFVPALVTLLDNWIQWSSISPLATSLVVLSLPLSSLWASAQSDILAERQILRNLSRNQSRQGDGNSTPDHEKRSYKAYKLERTDSADLHEHHDRDLDISS